MANPPTSEPRLDEVAGWQRCPVCEGRGVVRYPPNTTAQQSGFTSSSCGPWPCPKCKGAMVLALYRPAGETRAGDTTQMRRFTVYRRGDLSATHNDQQAAPPDAPQYEGVVFSDGRVALRWLTPLRSVSVWDSLDDALGVHGHPEPRYGTELVWHDAALPPSHAGDKQ